MTTVAGRCNQPGDLPNVEEIGEVGQIGRRLDLEQLVNIRLRGQRRAMRVRRDDGVGHGVPGCRSQQRLLRSLIGRASAPDR